jgi:hypothetical protein
MDRMEDSEKNGHDKSETPLKKAKASRRKKKSPPKGTH